MRNQLEIANAGKVASIVLSFVLSGFFLFNSAAAAQGEVKNLRIKKILVAGNRTVTRSQILSRTRSRVGEFFDEETAGEDARRIAKLDAVQYSYYNTATVDDGVELTFVVVEKNLVRSIDFVSNERISDKKLKKKLDLKTGDYLDPFLAEVGRRDIVDYYKQKGYAFVEVTQDSEALEYGKLVYVITEGPRVRIDAVRFEGNEKLSSAKLKPVVKTEKRKWFVMPAYYVEEKVLEDVTRLENAYHKRGFLDVKVEAVTAFNESRTKVRITFEIDEGPVYKVDEVTIKGNEFFDEQHLSSKLEIEKGQVYSELQSESEAKRLEGLYREKGFINSTVTARRSFVGQSQVAVEFEIKEGNRLRIGRINISGNEQTQDKVVRRILDEYDFQPGAWYNAEIAQGDGSGYLEKLIRRKTYMKSATITPSGDKPNQRNAEVSVIEGQTGSIMLGAGVASDSGLIGQVVFRQANFDIKDTPESFHEFITGKAFRGAGQNLTINLQPGTEVSQYSVNFTEPYLNNKPVALDVMGMSWERERESYDEGRLKGYVGLEKRHKNKWRTGVSFRAENVDVDSVDWNAPWEIQDVRGDNLLAGIKLGVGKDMTDDEFDPSQGYIIHADYEQVTGDHTFGILTATYRRYATLHEDLAERKTILATKLLGGTVVGDAPPFEKFYAGGSGTYGIRGFDYRGVSTRGRQRNAPAIKDDPIGSDWVFLANAEVSVPLISDNFYGLFFVDSGAIDTGNYRAAVGTGIEIKIPRWFGPVPMRFSIAAPLMKDDNDDTEVFSFSVGRLF